jgi:hypothetical protein
MANCATLTYHIFAKPETLDQHGTEYISKLSECLDQKGVNRYGSGHVTRPAPEYLCCSFRISENEAQLAIVPPSRAGFINLLTVSTESDYYSSEYVQLWIGYETLDRDDLGVITPKRRIEAVRQFALAMGQPCMTLAQQIDEVTLNRTFPAEFIED